MRRTWKAWLFVGLFVVFIRVAEYLLQGDDVEVNDFRTEVVQYYELFIGGGLVSCRTAWMHS